MLHLPGILGGTRSVPPPGEAPAIHPERQRIIDMPAGTVIELTDSGSKWSTFVNAYSMVDDAGWAPDAGVAGPGSLADCHAYGGGCLAERLERFIVGMAGHADGASNAVIGYSLDTFEYELMIEPSGPTLTNPNNDPFEHDELPDGPNGSPMSVHSYQTFCDCPAGDTLTFFHGEAAWSLGLDRIAGAWKVDGTGPTFVWSKTNPLATYVQLGQFNASLYHPGRGTIIKVFGASGGSNLYYTEWDPATGLWTEYGFAFTPTNGADQIHVLDHSRDRLWMLGGGLSKYHSVAVNDMPSDRVNVTPTGETSVIAQNGLGGYYDALRDEIVLMVPGSNDLYIMDPDTFAITRETFTGPVNDHGQSLAIRVRGKFSRHAGLDRPMLMSNSGKVFVWRR